MEIDRPDVNKGLLGSNATLVSRQVDITSEATLWFTSVVFRVYVTPATSVFGLVSNIINVFVFSRMNLKEGASATFLVLSIADGLMCFLGIFALVFSALKHMGPTRLVRSANGLYFMVLSAASFPRYASIFATVVIAVVRCCSVAMPLQVKSILTARRQMVPIVLLVLVTIGVQAYGSTMYKYIFIRDPQTNWTHLILTLTPGFIQKVKVVDQYSGISFYGSFIVVNICLVILVVALRRSSQFRTKASGTDASGVSADDKSRRKERQVVKTVVLVSLAFTICNIPGIAMAILRQTLPGFRTVGYLYRSFDMLFIFVEAFSQIGSATNIIIYLYSNSNYRKIFNDTFLPNRKKVLTKG